MGDRDRDRDRPKKSWRELDSQRDRGGPRTPQGQQPRPSPHQAEVASKQYRAQLDALFAKGEVGKFAEKLMGRNEPAKVERAEVKPEAPAEPPPPQKEDPRIVARKKLLEALGRDDISRAFDRYVKAHGMPGDFELLEQGLEHNAGERQREVLETLDKLLGREKPKRSRTLSGKLRLIEETSSDDDLRQFAARVRAKL